MLLSSVAKEYKGGGSCRRAMILNLARADQSSGGKSQMAGQTLGKYNERV